MWGRWHTELVFYSKPYNVKSGQALASRDTQKTEGSAGTGAKGKKGSPCWFTEKKATAV